MEKQIHFSYNKIRFLLTQNVEFSVNISVVVSWLRIKKQITIYDLLKCRKLFVERSL